MQMVHPDDKSDKITERQKAKEIIKAIDKIQKNGYFEKIEHHIKPYYKFRKHE